MTEHDEIILNLTDKKIISLLKKYMGNIKNLEIQNTYEFPLINKYDKFSKIYGYIDLIVNLFSKDNYSEFDNKELLLTQFIIEVKTEKDFKDFSQILRQIKMYKEYYSSPRFKKNELIHNNYYFNYNRKLFCLLSTKIPTKIKKIFENESIICLEIGELKKK